MMNTLDLIATKLDIRRANPRAYVQQRIGENAQALSRAGEAAARVERLNEALCRLVEILYQVDEDGSLPNIDAVTHRLRIPAPFGAKGWRRWGLRRAEGRALAAILRQRSTGQRQPLFDWNDAGSTWHLSIGSYPVIESAQLYLQRKPISLAEWRWALQAVPGDMPKYAPSRVPNGVPGRGLRGAVTEGGG